MLDPIQIDLRSNCTNSLSFALLCLHIGCVLANTKPYSHRFTFYSQKRSFLTFLLCICRKVLANWLRLDNIRPCSQRSTFGSQFLCCAKGAHFLTFVVKCLHMRCFLDNISRPYSHRSTVGSQFHRFVRIAPRFRTFALKRLYIGCVLSNIKPYSHRSTFGMRFLCCAKRSPLSYICRKVLAVGCVLETILRNGFYTFRHLP